MLTLSSCVLGLRLPGRMFSFMYSTDSVQAPSWDPFLFLSRMKQNDSSEIRSPPCSEHRNKKCFSALETREVACLMSENC